MMNEDKNFMAEVQQAYELKKQEEKAPSVDDAWKQFNGKYHVTEETQTVIAPRRSFWKRYGVAASFLLVGMVAVSLVRNEELGERSEELIDNSEEYKIEEIVENETSIIYRNVALSQIVEQLAVAHNASVDYLASADIRLYVELDRNWTLQESIDFLNHFEHVRLVLTPDQTIEVR